MRHPFLVGVLALLLLLGGCGDDESNGGTDAGSATTTSQTVAGGDDTTTSTTPGDDVGGGSEGGEGMCEYVGVQDIEAIVASSPEDLTVEGAMAMMPGQCSFTVTRDQGAQTYVHITPWNEPLFDSTRESEDTTDLPGLGDDAYQYEGPTNSSIFARKGDVYFSVEFGGFTEETGLTSDMLEGLVRLVLDRM